MSELDKLRWRWRRGTLELDLMLSRYLENCYQTADQSERQVFLRLLELEDIELMGYLIGEVEPEDKGLAGVV